MRTTRRGRFLAIPLLVLIAGTADSTISAAGGKEAAPGVPPAIPARDPITTANGTIRRAPIDQCGEYIVDPDPGFESKLIYVGSSMPGDFDSWDLLVGQHV